MPAVTDLLEDPRWDTLSREQRAQARERLFVAYLSEDDARKRDFLARAEPEQTQLFGEFVDRLQAKYPDKFATEVKTGRTPLRRLYSVQEAEERGLEDTTEELENPWRREPPAPGSIPVPWMDHPRPKPPAPETVRVPVLDPASEAKLAAVGRANETKQGTGFDTWTADDFARMGPIVDVMYPGAAHVARAEGTPKLNARAKELGMPEYEAVAVAARQTAEGIISPLMWAAEKMTEDDPDVQATRALNAGYDWVLDAGGGFESAGAVAALATGGVAAAKVIPRLASPAGIAKLALLDAGLGAAYARSAPGYLAGAVREWSGEENATRDAILTGMEAAGFAAATGMGLRQLTGARLKTYARGLGWEGETLGDLKDWVDAQRASRAQPVHTEPIGRTIPGEPGTAPAPAGGARAPQPPGPARPATPEPGAATPQPGAAAAPSPGAAATFAAKRAGTTLPDQVVAGAETAVLGARGVELPARYVYAPRAIVQAAHLGGTFSKNPEYPLENTRDYGNFAEQEKVLGVRNGFDARRHVTDSPDAAVGPAVIAHVVDEQGASRLVVLGGNNREMAISMLEPAAAQELTAYTASRAERFGLPVPEDGQALYRFVGDYDLRTEGTRAKLQNVIDALNPAPGKVQNISEQARVDADNNVPVPRLQGVPMNLAPAAAQEFVRTLLREGALDRNLRSAFAESGAQAQAYVNHLLLHGAYRVPSLVEARMDSRGGEVGVVRGMIDAGVRPVLQLRAGGRADVADAIARTFSQVARAVAAAEAAAPAAGGKRKAIAGADKRSTLVKAFADLAAQTDIDPAMAVVQELAAALGRKVVRGKGGVVVEGLTVDGMEDLLDDVARALELQGNGADLFGEAPDAVATIKRAIEFHFGATEGAGVPGEAGAGALMDADDPAAAASPAGRAVVSPYRQMVQRLRALRKKARDTTLTPAEHQEIDQLDAQLGQQFLEFYAPGSTANGMRPALGPVEVSPEFVAGSTVRRMAEAAERLAPGQAHMWFELETADKGVGKRGAYLPITFRDLDKIRTIEMPEAVALVEYLLGALPRIEKLPKALGCFFPRGAGRISLDPRIFVDSSVAIRVLLHELGHAVDYLPTHSIERGNLLGRIATLRNYMLQTLDLKPTDPSQALARLDYERMERAAAKAAGARPAASDPGRVAAWKADVRKRYHAMVENEIVRRKLVKASVVFHELWELSNWWKPIPSGAPQPYIDYRRSAVELYADALSVLFNSPADLMDRAPTFWKMWFDYLDRKPEVKQAFFDLQDLLTQPYTQVLGARKQKIAGMFAKGEEILMRKWEEREATRGTFVGWWDKFRTQVDNVYWPIIRRARAATAAGAKLGGRWDPETIFGEHPLSGNQSYVWLQRLHEKVVGPLEARGLGLEQLGRYLFLNRVRHEILPARGDMPGGRAQLANPLGMTPETARLQLLQMRLDLGMEAMGALEGFARGFQDLVFEQVQEAVRVGNYPAAALGALRANRYNYATFLVLDHFDPYVPSGIKKQKGTFAPIGNPFTATVLKTITLIRANQLQEAKVTATKLLRDHFPAEIRIRLKPSELLKPGEKEMRVMVNGRPVSLAVPADVVDMFDGVKPADASAIAGVLNWAFRKTIYPLWITYSVPFQLFTSPIRDFQRAFVNLPHGAGLRLLGEYLGNLGTFGVESFNASLRAAKVPWQMPVPMTDAARTARALVGTGQTEPGRQAHGQPGTQDPAGFAREMLVNSAVGTPLDALATHRRDDALGKLLEQMRLLTPKARWPFLDKHVFRLVRALGRAIEFAGLTNEVLPKVVGYKILAKELGWSPAAAADFVRNHVGVPNIHEQGRDTRLIQSFLPFFNVFLKGYQHDWRLASSKPSAAGWWFRWAATSGMWSMLQALAKLGAFGAAAKLLYDRISEYDATNYTVLPVGEVRGGDYGAKTVHFRIPRDETHRFMAGLLYKSITAAGGVPGAQWNEVFAFGSGQVPGLNPLVDISKKWLTYLGGVNPRDYFRNRDILSPQVFRAGGWDANKGMLLWTYNQSGLANFVKIDPEANTWLEFSLTTLPGLNRLIKVSDYGLREAQYDAINQAQAVRDRARLRYSDDVRRTLGEYYTLRTLGDMRTAEQNVRYATVAGWYQKSLRPLEEVMFTQLEAGDQAAADRTRATIDTITQAFRAAREGQP